MSLIFRKLTVAFILFIVCDVSFAVNFFVDKVVLVTGASGDIGDKIVESFVKEGAFVIAHCNLNQSKASELAKKYADKCIVIKSDFSNPLNAADLWKRSLSWKKRIDFLINNAGILEFTSHRDNDEKWCKTWTNTLNVNLIAPSLLCK